MDSMCKEPGCREPAMMHYRKATAIRCGCWRLGDRCAYHEGVRRGGESIDKAVLETRARMKQLEEAGILESTPISPALKSRVEEILEPSATKGAE